VLLHAAEDSNRARYGPVSGARFFIVAYLCGRPGCSEESAATLQIDALSETVTLVDARVSRDGVPLCARHADATTPPMGWAMNDMRSNSAGRALAAVPDEREVPRTTPPRVRPEPSADATPQGRPQTRRPRVTGDDDRSGAGARPTREVAPVADPEPVGRRQSSGEEVPASRPSRRRGEDGELQPAAEGESFPWHHQFDDDEAPSELQASSPLLSRAFRSTAG
jgi:hypothetical protein